MRKQLIRILVAICVFVFIFGGLYGLRAILRDYIHLSDTTILKCWIAYTAGAATLKFLRETRKL